MKLWEFDNFYRLKENKEILGIDEAGRGAVAGPVVIVGVILPKEYNNDLINDSKQLNENLRESLYYEILSEAKFVRIEIIDSKRIDKENIHKVIIEANNSIASSLADSFTLTDFIKIPNEKIRHISLIKGDSKSLSIAAASIIAKVSRDNIMRNLSYQFPQYKFEKNKGYGTEEHINIIKKNGISNVHRKSYRIKKIEKSS